MSLKYSFFLLTGGPKAQLHHYTTHSTIPKVIIPQLRNALSRRTNNSMYTNRETKGISSQPISKNIGFSTTVGDLGSPPSSINLLISSEPAQHSYGKVIHP